MNKTSRIVIVVALVILVAAGVLVSVNRHAANQMAVQQAAVAQQQAAQAAAASSATGSTGARGPEQKTILIGQSGVVGGITVKVVGLMQDSRCPTNITCIQAGSFGVHTTITKGSITTDHDFISGTAPYAFEGYNLSIKSVTPSPVSGQPTIALSDYRITFMATAK